MSLLISCLKSLPRTTEWNLVFGEEVDACPRSILWCAVRTGPIGLHLKCAVHTGPIGLHLKCAVHTGPIGLHMKWTRGTPGTNLTQIWSQLKWYYEWPWVEKSVSRLEGVCVWWWVCELALGLLSIGQFLTNLFRTIYLKEVSLSPSRVMLLLWQSFLSGLVWFKQVGKAWPLANGGRHWAVFWGTARLIWGTVEWVPHWWLPTAGLAPSQNPFSPRNYLSTNI